jgi:hypothetical protein
MEISAAQYAPIKASASVHQGEASMTDVQGLNNIQCFAEQGCKWRGCQNVLAIGSPFMHEYNDGQSKTAGTLVLPAAMSANYTSSCRVVAARLQLREASP